MLAHPSEANPTILKLILFRLIIYLGHHSYQWYICLILLMATSYFTVHICYNVRN